MNADQLIAQVLEGADPEKVVVDLVEKRQKAAKTGIFFHGTSMKRWKKIKRKGFDPDADKIWADLSPSGSGKSSLASFPGTYFTRNLLTARQSAWKTAGRDKSNEVMVVARLQPRSAFVDEDNVRFATIDAVSWGVKGNNSLMLIEAWVDHKWGNGKFANEARDRFVEESVDYFKKKFERRDMHPELERVLTAHLKEMFWDFLERDVAFLHPNDFRERFARALSGKRAERAGIDPEQVSLWIEGPKFQPDRVEAQRVARANLEQLTRTLRQLAVAGNENVVNIRMTEPVDFKGANRIIAAVETVPVEETGKGDFKVTHYYERVIFGRIPPEFEQQYREKVNSRGIPWLADRK